MHENNIPTDRIPTDHELLALIQTLSLAEKAALCSGLDAWHTKPNAAKGIPSLLMADGPHGVRVPDPKNRRANGGLSKPATCWPAEVSLACGWSPELARQIGEAAAEEAKHYGVGLLLGPGVNVKRHPLNGRNFEYYSEDPLLAGELAVGFINGLQNADVGASLKHYAVNNQETLRMSINAAVDERTLFDIYLRPFEIAIQKAQPDTVMASYNRVNGSYATENRRLLTDILRLRFGFTGAVVSDWGAVNNRPAGIAAGMDLEMPGSGGVTDWALEQAVKTGALPEDALDAACWNILRLVFRRNRQNKARPTANWNAHHALAAKVAEQCIVLLKNDGLLPFSKNIGRIAVIGELADKPRYQGSGSSVMNPSRLTSLLQGLKAAGQPFVYAAGYKQGGANAQMLATAVAAAKNAPAVVLVLGLPSIYESEGFDRDHLQLPPGQLRLLDAVTAANPNTCVVLCCGGPVETPWLPKVRALLCPHLSGQAQGEALTRLLFGSANPAGKLAETWPLALPHSPAHHHFPMGPNEVRYNESIFVGYRYYQTAGQAVQFPFGFGLSYTDFVYKSIELSSDKITADKMIAVSVTVQNSGQWDGDEIVQLYVKRESSSTCQPALELVAFARVSLSAGETRVIELQLPYQALGFTAPAFGKRVVEAGDYSLLAGPNCANLPLCATLYAEGVQLPKDEAALAHYGNITGNHFPDEGFAAIYSAETLGDAPCARGNYAAHTPLSHMHASATGRALGALVRFVALHTIDFSPDKPTNRRAALQMARELPFKNVLLNAAGVLPPKACAALLDMANGRGGVGRLLQGLLGKRPYKRP